LPLYAKRRLIWHGEGKSTLGMLEGDGITPCGYPVWVVTGVTQYTTCMCGTAGWGECDVLCGRGVNATTRK